MRANVVFNLVRVTACCSAYILWFFLGLFGAHVRTKPLPHEPQQQWIPACAAHKWDANPPPPCRVGLILHLLQRFYVGRPVSGLVWLFTCGLFGLGWVVDFFLLSDFVEGACASAGGPDASIELPR